MPIIKSITRWWNGEWETYDYPIIGVTLDRHWTSWWAHAALDWVTRNGWQIVGTVIAAAGVWVWYLAIK